MLDYIHVEDYAVRTTRVEKIRWCTRGEWGLPKSDQRKNEGYFWKMAGERLRTLQILTEIKL